MAVRRNRVPRIVLDGCQFKSIGKLRRAAKALHVLEVETGIHECEITLLDCFICPDITEAELDSLARTPMGKVLTAIVRKIRRPEAAAKNI
jgi:hypothetical protein